ncbi:GH15560 [Drosophila grimshawi]|uniref:GH15560 n=1 Tax=Drosophila grimshawi TaxID=7222 RepID=B4J1D2_DROGR|nr:GH15560 [Drosophila grimshawi]
MVKSKAEPVYGTGLIASNLLSEGDMVEREKKYTQRLLDIGVSSAFIKESTLEFERLEEERRLREHWDHHLRCDGLPRPYLPPEMRTFIEKKRYFQQLDVDHSVDWTLSVDERTVLTQDIFRNERTRTKVKELMDDHVGDRFEQDIIMYLDTLVKIDCMLDTAAEMEYVRKELEHEIDTSFDRLTYRIIRMDGVYMNSKDAMVATWSHAGARYDIDIWGLRDVPIRFKELPTPLMVAELKTAGVEVQMPLSVLHDCLTLRCIHTKFDNHSQYAKSFDPIIPDSPVQANGGIVDIEDCLINEWLMQLDIQQELLASMMAKRENYEDIMRTIAEKTEKMNKEKKANEGKSTKTVIPKAPKEPPLVPPGMFPDAYATFLEREQQQYLDTLDEIYNPRHLKLTSDEVNMRQHIMLGGLYSIMFVRQTPGTHYEKFNIMLHEDGRILHIMDDIVADLRAPTWADDVSARRSRLQMDEQKRKTLNIDETELPYFFVTIHMPRELCMWGDPIACQYITSMQEPRISRRENQSVNVFRPTLISRLRASHKLGPQQHLIGLSNFQLEQKLNHLQARQLERFCVPRIISSFKFPMEVREELQQQLDQRPKMKNMLIRRRSIEAEENTVIGDLDFDYYAQEAPERLFPIYANLEHVDYDDGDLDSEMIDKKSIYGLLNTLDTHRLLYTTRYTAIMKQPDFDFKKVPSKKTIMSSAEARASSMFAKKITQRPSTMRENHSIFATPSQTWSELRSTSRARLSLTGDTADDVSLERVYPFENPRDDAEVAGKVKVKVTHWTTKHIHNTKFDRQARTMTIETDRLGIFGFAYKRYDHFPFRDWSMQPNEENNDEIILTVDTFRARVVLYITGQGIRGYVTDISNVYVANPVKYLEITTPISDYRELRRRFYEKNVNIFAENDAGFYIENGYFSVKHVALENHTYDAMSLHCKLMKFYRSSWNRLSSRRNILMCMKNAKDNTDYTEATLRLTPDDVTFVEVSELCSDDLDVIKLDFKLTWRNMTHYTDLHQAILSMNPHANDVRNKDSLLLFQVKRILNEIRLLSFS